jgi:hypothetical protein
MQGGVTAGGIMGYVRRLYVNGMMALGDSLVLSGKMPETVV